LIALAACGQQNAYVPPPPAKGRGGPAAQEKVPLYRAHWQYGSVAEVKLERAQGFLNRSNMWMAPRSKGDLLFVISRTPPGAARAGEAALQSN
jgi:hypothetical protein